MIYPKKDTYDQTISDQLRKDLFKFSTGFKKASYLEIGFDKGFTMATLSPYFKSMYGVDISRDCFNEANKLFSQNKIKNAMLFCGDSGRVPFNRYDVILVDADKSYESVLLDTFNVLTKNFNDNPFLIIYNGYSIIGAGIKKFCDEFFQDFMVPVGDKGAEEPEAVACAFDSEMKKKYLKLLEEKFASISN